MLSITCEVSTSLYNLRLTSSAKYNETIRSTVVAIILDSSKSDDVNYYVVMSLPTW